MTITLRQETATGATTKLDTLTYKELDDNFIHLLNNKIRPLQVDADTGVVTVGEAQSNGVFSITGSTGLSTTVTEDSTGNANLTISLDQVTGSNLNVTIYAKASENLSAGDVVQFAGVQGDHLLVKKAVIDDSAGAFISEYIVGVAPTAFATNDFGYFVTQGLVTDASLNLSAFSVGQILWYDPTTSGGLTATEPSAPNPKVRVAAVLRANGSDDIMLVRPTFSKKLTDAEDVDTEAAANNDYLVYNSATGVWQHQALDISTDTTPQLGGTLNANSNNFTNVGTINSHTIPGGSGTFALTSDIPTDTDTTYSISAETTTGGANLRLTDSSAGTDDVKIAQGTNITVTRTDANTITIASTVTSGIANVVEDTTPQLGGPLDVNGNAIVSSSNQDINLNPDGTGKVNINNTYTLPNTDGTNGQVLTTNGTGTLSFTTVSGGASDLNSLTDVTITSPADNQFLRYDSGTSKFINETVTLNENFNDLNDVSVASASNGQSIQYNSGSGQWEPYTPSSGGANVLNDLTDVSASGPTNGQVIQYNSGASQWQTVTLSFLSNVSEDTTPQLGGTLDCQDNVVQSPDLKDYKETVYSLGTTDNPSISISNGNVQSVTISSGLNLPAFNDAATGQSVTLIVSGSGSATGTGAYIFAGGNKTLTTKSIVSIFYDGTNYWTSISTDFQA